MYNRTECPICNGNSFQLFLTCKDYTVSKFDFTIVSCNSCGFKFTNPIPPADKLGDYYQSEEYISHSNTKKGLIANLYHFVRSYTLKGKLKYISLFKSQGSLLDYGCGTGMFLSTAKQNGWKVIGLEPDSGAANIASSQIGKVFHNIQDLSAELPKLKVDVISLWHVLEHVNDLNETLLYFKSILNSDGILIIAVPNYCSYDATYYKEFWAAYDVPRHLYHFDKQSMIKLLSKFDFELVETKGMKFDSFYVSLLSEKYKHGRTRYLPAFLIGLLSNLKAFKNNNYSSIIYTFRIKA